MESPGNFYRKNVALPHLPVLGRDADLGFKVRVVSQCFNYGRHLDGFGASAEYGKYFHWFQST